MKKTKNSLNHISLSITEGRLVRDLLDNDLLDYFKDSEYQTTIYSEASEIDSFTNTYKNNYVDFKYLYPCGTNTSRSRAYWMRRRFNKISTSYLLKKFCDFEENLFYPAKTSYLNQLTSDRSKVLLTTNAHLANERELITSAHKLNIPTIGFVKSWDNIHKGIHSRTNKIAVWNDINKQELIDIEKYKPDDIFVTGPPQFDQYFKQDIIIDRDEYFANIELDPNRPTIFFATIGDFGFNIDESYWLDLLINQITNGDIKGEPQVICRLHPWSKLELFQKYSSIPWVKISYIHKFIPSLSWYMDKKEVIMMANMINHSDLVISPGSTVLLESAIFNRPTLFPIFHDFQPERASQYFSQWVLGKHFDRIKQLNLVPIVDKSQHFPSIVNKCLKNPNWYSKQRNQLVKDYIQFTDGNSTKRLADRVLRLAQTK